MEEPRLPKDNDIHQKNIPLIQVIKIENILEPPSPPSKSNSKKEKQHVNTGDLDGDDDDEIHSHRLLIFQTTCMSSKRAYTIFWLALHQLWVLSWMGHDSRNRPIAIRLCDWLVAVQAAEQDMKISKKKQHAIARSLTTTTTATGTRTTTISGDRLLCSNDLFHIAGGMNRWMIVTQRYLVNTTGANDSANPALAYVINPSIAVAIHQFLDASKTTDFRFRPGVPIHVPDSSSSMNNDSPKKWKYLFSGFPVDLEQAHRRFVSRLSRVHRVGLAPVHKKQKRSVDHESDM